MCFIDYIWSNINILGFFMIKKTMLSLYLGLSTLILFQPLFAEGQFYVFSDIGSSANTDYSFTEAKSPLIRNDINYTSYRLGGGYSFDLTKHFSIGTEAAYNFYGKEDYYLALMIFYL